MVDKKRFIEGHDVCICHDTIRTLENISIDMMIWYESRTDKTSEACDLSKVQAYGGVISGHALPLKYVDYVT